GGSPQSLAASPAARSIALSRHGCCRRTPGRCHHPRREGRSLRRLRCGRRYLQRAADAFLRRHRADVTRLHSRSPEAGSGTNAPALRRLAAEGVKVVITVDCGTLAFAPLEDAAAQGIEVIVIDHHLAEPELPRAIAVVNPNRLDEIPGFGQLAAVGVAFLFVV